MDGTRSCTLRIHYKNVFIKRFLPTMGIHVYSNFRYVLISIAFRVGLNGKILHKENTYIRILYYIHLIYGRSKF